MKATDGTITLLINHRRVTVPDGATILQAARAAGVEIPTLCYFPRLGIQGNCRLCIVEVEGYDSLLPACSTPAEENMTVITDSPKVAEARTAVLELLLIHHPLECPTCGRAGECELQDLVGRYGPGEMRLKVKAMGFPVVEDNPFIVRDMNRCVSCGRCVRICQDFQKAGAIDFVGRGINLQVAPPFEGPLRCEFCGQCIDVCPSGALSSRLFPPETRPWELNRVETVCALCGTGCRLVMEGKGGKIFRVSGIFEKGANRGNLCARGRFGFSHLEHGHRLTQPLTKKNGRLAPISWEEAVGKAGEALSKVVTAHGPEAVAGIGSPHMTNEEAYAFQRLLRAGIGTNMLGSRNDLGHGQAAGMLRDSLGLGAGTATFASLKKADLVLVVARHLAATNPVAVLNILEVQGRGGKVIVISPLKDKLARLADLWLPTRPGGEDNILRSLTGLAVSLQKEPPPWPVVAPDSIEALSPAEPGSPEALKKAARWWNRSRRTVLVMATGHCEAAASPAAVQSGIGLLILTGRVGKPGSGLLLITTEANAQGCFDMGLDHRFLPGHHPITDPVAAEGFQSLWGNISKPHQGGVDQILDGILSGRIRALYLVGESPLTAFPRGDLWRRALANLEVLIVQELFTSDITALGSVVIPGMDVLEKEGTITNGERRVQAIRPAVAAPADFRPDWSIFRDLSRSLGNDPGWGSLRDVRREMARAIPFCKPVFDRPLMADDICWPVHPDQGEGTEDPYRDRFFSGLPRLSPPLPRPSAPEGGFCLMMTSHLFSSGTMLRYDSNLSKVQPPPGVYLSPEDLEAGGFKEGEMIIIEREDRTIQAPVGVDPLIPPKTAVVYLDHVEVDACRLMDFDNLGLCCPVNLRKIGL